MMQKEQAEAVAARALAKAKRKEAVGLKQVRRRRRRLAAEAGDYVPATGCRASGQPLLPAGAPRPVTWAAAHHSPGPGLAA